MNSIRDVTIFSNEIEIHVSTTLSVISYISFFISSIFHAYDYVSI